MAVPIKLLASNHKLDRESLAAAFDNKTLEKRPEVKKLVENIRDIISNGINRNRTDYRLFKAMDWAYDAPFYQVSYTQLRGLISSQPDDKKVMSAINSWGLAHLLQDVTKDGKVCCGTDGKPLKAVNLPIFFNIFVPVVMAYITIRWAKLFNDRNLNPHFKYEPVQFTKENRFRCEVITQIVQRQSAQFDYPADTKQTILQTLMYGYCINFPREAWFVEKQLDEDGKEHVVKEGLRFNMPHPSRVYYDLYNRLSSLNSNSGCEYAGYWEIRRYKDIHADPLFWNKDVISIGASSWLGFEGGSSDFLQQVYPCAMTFPDPSCTATGSIGGVGDNDRSSAAAKCYMSGDFDRATLITQHFQRIVPKDCGLGDYPYPVWFRFLFASDNAVIWAEPLSFSVLPTYTYDADFNRSRFRSLALEIMPFQDHISNLLTQWILMVKENMTNPVFFDKEKIPSTYLSQLENMGQKFHNGRLFIPFSGTENYRTHNDQREAFFIPNMSRHPTGEIATLISGVISMLDRMMQLSPQEIGQAAPHEQTAEESRIIAGNTSTRVVFTGTGIDSGDYAKKCMIYDANMAHADPDITVGISSTLASTEEEFKKLLKSVGFELSGEAKFDPQSPQIMHTVTGKMSSLGVESFASTRDNTERINLPAVADAMSKIFLAVAGNPVLIQAIGPVQLVELLNQIIQTSGLPQEFRLRGKHVDPEAAGKTPEEQANEVAEMMKKFAEQVQQLVAQKQQETLQLAGQQTEQVVGQAMQAAAQQTQQVVAQGAAAAAEGLQQAAPAIQQAQQAAQVAAQKIVEHEQALAAQQEEIQSLGQAVAQLTAAIQQAQGAPLVPA